MLLAEDGYDPHTGLLLQLKGLTENLRADIPKHEALALLYEVFGEFPYVEAAGWAHTLCMVLQPFVRPLIQGATPLYLIDAPARGTGKGLLTEAANLIPFWLCGAHHELNLRDGDELEKRLTSCVARGSSAGFSRQRDTFRLDALSRRAYRRGLAGAHPG